MRAFTTINTQPRDRIGYGKRMDGSALPDAFGSNNEVAR